MTEVRKAVVFGVKCAGCGRMRYLKTRPPKGPYQCASCRAPAVPSKTTAAPPPTSSDPFYTDDARREALASPDGRRPWIPKRRDWLRR